MAIASFNCAKTKAVFDGARSPQFNTFRGILERKLAMLDAAISVNDLRWTVEGPAEVECVDYRRGGRFRASAEVGADDEAQEQDASGPPR